MTRCQGTSPPAAGEPSDEFTAHFVAGQIFSAQRILTFHNAQAIRAGHSADDTYPSAVTRAEIAFDYLANGAYFKQYAEWSDADWAAARQAIEARTAQDKALRSTGGA